MGQSVFRLSGLFAVSLLVAGGVAQAKGKEEISESCKKASAPYKKAYGAYDKKAKVYWKKISYKKSVRTKKRKAGKPILRKDYVLTHPPAYKGPKKPACLRKKTTKRRMRVIGLVKDYLKAAEKLYKFKPAPVSEKTFKTAYAREALKVGLTAEQVVGVYALETGGLGPYNRQSGIFNVNSKCKLIKPKGRPASTALGYAQLLTANTAAVLNENSERFAKALETQAKLSQEKRREELLKKAALVRRMAKDVRVGIRKYKNRNNWREYVAFGKTKGGFAVHTLNLDVDIGPMVQVRKLKKIVEVAKRKGFKTVSSAQLELMNLVGYGRGLEMMRPVADDVPTSNFFSRGGYFRNPVAKNKTAGGLLKRLGSIIKKRRKNCGSKEFIQAFKSVAG